MTLSRQSQIPAAPVSQPLEARERPSTPPLRLLRTTLTGEALPLRGLKGEGPGSFHVGAPILAPGARVGVLCDTLHGDREVGLDYAQGIERACELIEHLGFVPVVDTLHAQVAPYYTRWAGSPTARAEHFIRLLEQHAVDAVFPLFGKGGFHAVVDAVYASGFVPRRKVVLIGGFSHHSDWTLFGASERGRAFFSHMINATQCAYWKMLPEANVENLEHTLKRARALEYTGLRGLNEAAQTGKPQAGALVGGNLAAILRNLDKPWCPSFAGKIVVCEDYGQHPHEVHFRVTQLAHVMQAAGAQAIVIAAMLPQKRPELAKLEPTERKRQTELDQAEILDVLREACASASIPVYYHSGICSHGAMNYPLALGGLTRIRTHADGEISLENALEVV